MFKVGDKVTRKKKYPSNLFPIINGIPRAVTINIVSGGTVFFEEMDLGGMTWIAEKFELVEEDNSEIGLIKQIGYARIYNERS